ncbi:hypothetical protein N9W09_00455 [Crocinitomicaceae bacterium]|nr:hypothetical protein [Crocinitomicaceae bacterium]
MRDVIRMDENELQQRIELIEAFERDDSWQDMTEQEQAEIKTIILTISLETLGQLVEESRIKH